MRTIAWVALLSCSSGIAFADDIVPPLVAPPPPSRLSVHGFVDLYVAEDFNRPDGASFTPGTGTNAKRSGEMSLNLAEVALSTTPDPAHPIGADLVLAYGTATDIEHAGEITAEGVGPDVWRLLQRATLSYTHGPVVIEAGIMPSHIGFESFASKDNWTYTHGWLAEYTPYYETGVRVAYTFSPALLGQLYVVNGWQLIGDNNEMKSVGTQLVWSSPTRSLAFNTLSGPETPGDNDHWRFFGDLIGSLQLTPSFTIAAELDGGVQQRAGLSSTSWQAAALYARYAITPGLAVAVRGEIWHDPDGVLATTGRTLGSGTLCVEWRPVGDALILKLEARYDRADQDLFGQHATNPDGTPTLGNDETLAILGAVASF